MHARNRPPRTLRAVRPVHPPALAVRAAVATALAEDLLPLGDLTSVLIPEDAQADAVLVSRQVGVFAGRDCFDETARQVDAAITVAWEVDDGAALEPGSVVARLTGPLRSVLTAERTALNFAGHLSGIATKTRRFVDLAAGGAIVWDTRKTTPGLRSLEKAAVRSGGGASHRGNLSDWVMIKDNHLTELSITDAVPTARDAWPGRTIHVECDTVEQVREAATAGADALLLDNMSPAEAGECVDAARGILAGRPCLIEASGGVNADTIAAYAGCGVDAVSIGALTNSAPVLDLGLDIAPAGPIAKDS
jgi:nicotinate-nucleotide pyrophosphorylase (carboxylating)